MRLTSANSINIGRLLPQMIYYFHAVAQLESAGLGPTPVVSTPSGNFGNLTAGVMAKLFRVPRTSVNHRRTNRTPRSSTVRRT